MDKKPQQCPECGAPEGRAHTLKCSLISNEDRLQSTIQTLEKQVTRYREHAQRSHAAIAEWHGRYAIVKSENNALRRQVRGTRRQTASLMKAEKQADG